MYQNVPYNRKFQFTSEPFVKAKFVTVLWSMVLVLWIITTTSLGEIMLSLSTIFSNRSFQQNKIVELQEARQ